MGTTARTGPPAARNPATVNRQPDWGPPPAGHAQLRPAPPEGWPKPGLDAKTAGDAARGFLRVYQQIPLLSAPGDLIKAKNGIQLLTAAIEERPTHPAGYLWLADGILRARRDGLALAAIRSVIDPTAIIELLAVRTAAGLGLDEPIHVSLRRRAFLLACSRLRQHPSDAESLYYASRVYMVQGHAQQALRFSWMSAGQAPAETLPLVVSGLALCQLGRAQEAEAVAWRILDRANSLGLLVLAEVTRQAVAGRRTAEYLCSRGFGHMTGAGPVLAAPPKKVAAALSSWPHPADLAAFLGPHPSAVDTVREAFKSQKKKLGFS